MGELERGRGGRGNGRVFHPDLPCALEMGAESEKGHNRRSTAELQMKMGAWTWRDEGRGKSCRELTCFPGYSPEMSTVVGGWDKERSRGGKLVREELCDPLRLGGEQDSGGLLQSWG